MNNKPPRPHSLYPQHAISDLESSSAYSSLRELLDSLSREQLRNQDLLTALGFALRNFTNLHRFLELVPVIAARTVGVNGSLLVPFQSNGSLWRDQLQVLPSDGIGQELIRQLASFEPGKENTFADDKKQIMALDNLVQRQMPNSGIFSTSLLSRGRQRGRLYIFDLEGSLVWSEIHRKNLQLIADLSAVALENDSILREIRMHESVDRQLSIGAEIQAQLLPDSCPVIEGVDLAARCRPAYQVGGDYYDFMPTRPNLLGTRREKGNWAFVIGDVMGKGVPAGLLMTMLRGMLRAEVLSGLPPDRILHDLNQLAQEDLSHSHRFVTLFYSDYEPVNRRLRYSNAAHNPPLLWRASERRISRLDAPGLLIGLQSEAVYGCGEIFLEPGDVLLYYTDGVTEALGITGERFGEDRLIRFLEEFSRTAADAQSILDQLFKRLDSFIGADNHLEDDASMVVFQVNEELTLPHLNNSTT